MAPSLPYTTHQTHQQNLWALSSQQSQSTWHQLHCCHHSPIHRPPLPSFSRASNLSSLPLPFLCCSLSSIRQPEFSSQNPLMTPLITQSKSESSVNDSSGLGVTCAHLHLSDLPHHHPPPPRPAYPYSSHPCSASFSSHCGKLNNGSQIGPCSSSQKLLKQKGLGRSD